MNRSIRHIFLTATTACGLWLAPATAQTTATTDPVGAMTMTIPAGSVMIGPVFVNQALYEGSISSISESGNTTTIVFGSSAFEGENLSAGAFPRYYLEISSPANIEGYGFDIATNDDSSVTVYGSLSSDFGIKANDVASVREHVSIGQVFGNSDANLVAGSDSVRIFQSDGSSITLTYAGNSIWTSDFISDESAYPIYPGTGFITSFGNQVPIMFSGTVKTTATQVPLYSNAVNVVSLSSPLNTTLGSTEMARYLKLGSDSIRVMSKNGSFEQTGVYYAATTTIMTEDFVTSANATPIEGWLGFYASVGVDRYLKVLPADEM